MNTQIIQVSWGNMKVKVEDTILDFKDCKVWPEGAVNWNWRVTGTQHDPGIQPSDILEILDKGVEEMILSRGMDLMLKTCKETEDLLKSRNVRYHIEETKAAVVHFNDLMKKGVRVGGIFHSTC